MSDLDEQSCLDYDRNCLGVLRLEVSIGRELDFVTVSLLVSWIVMDLDSLINLTSNLYRCVSCVCVYLCECLLLVYEPN